MEQAARFGGLIREPRFASFEKELQPASGPKGTKKIPSDTVQKRKEKDDKNQQKDVSKEFLTWHSALPVAARSTKSCFSLRDTDGKPSEASTPGCENATLEARKNLGNRTAKVLAVFQIVDGAAEDFHAGVPRCVPTSTMPNAAVPRADNQEFAGLVKARVTISKCRSRSTKSAKS